MVGFSRLRQGIALQFQDELQKLVQEVLARHSGRLVNTMGDGFFAEFPTPIDSVKFALELQDIIARRNLPLEPGLRFQLRIGIHFGEVVARGPQVDGTNVVIAARTEPLAYPGGICMTEQVWRQIREELPHPAARLGRFRVKGIPQPLAFYCLYPSNTPGPARLRHRSRLLLNLPGRIPAALLASGLLVAAAILLRPFGEPLVAGLFPTPPARLVDRAAKTLERFDLEGHTTAAIIDLQAAIERGGTRNPPPDWLADAHAWLGFAYWRQFLTTRNYSDGWKAREQSTAATNSLNALAYQVLGLMALKEGDPTNACVLLSRANELQIGQNCEVLVRLAEANQLLGRPAAASNNLESAHAVAKKPWTAHLALGRYEFKHGTDLPAARTHLETALRKVPDSPLAWNNLAGLLVNTDEPADALKYVDSLLGQFPRLRSNPEFCSSKGSIFLALLDPSQAARWFLEAAALSPSNYRFWGNAGLAQLRIRGAEAQSHDHLTKAIQLAQLIYKNTPDCLVQAHISLYQAALGQKEEARINMSEALSKCPGDSQVRDAIEEATKRLRIKPRLQTVSSESASQTSPQPSKRQ